MRKKIIRFIEKYRFKLLLFFTLLFLIVPSYFKGSWIYNLLTFFSLTFIFIQSMYIILDRDKRSHRWILIIFMLVLAFTWFEVFESIKYVKLFKFLLYFIFFGITIGSLARFVNHSRKVTIDVMIVSVVIYLLMGIIAGSAAFLLNYIYPNAYHFTDPDPNADLLQMIYFGFVTLSTLGYGDITPARPETMTLSFLVAVAGQLYVAIIIAFIVGKYISSEEKS